MTRPKRQNQNQNVISGPLQQRFVHTTGQLTDGQTNGADLVGQIVHGHSAKSIYLVQRRSGSGHRGHRGRRNAERRAKIQHRLLHLLPIDTAFLLTVGPVRVAVARQVANTF
ncbi:hypothetical protein BpHYR1_038201 [Brachionus plicatilis]|uniref:Uncharacterized protein n=1 Tax=Brachionus plicatilis TaxID=10195 RepID=A0A3M7TAC0_BRAPC|nr:hypothetical protein BpHYR1_038201 [Brachionus plicatilis]